MVSPILPTPFVMPFPMRAVPTISPAVSQGRSLMAFAISFVYIAAPTGTDSRNNFGSRIAYSNPGGICATNSAVTAGERATPVPSDAHSRITGVSHIFSLIPGTPSQRSIPPRHHLPNPVSFSYIGYVTYRFNGVLCCSEIRSRLRSADCIYRLIRGYMRSLKLRIHVVGLYII